jgi:hypothetical protein
VALSVKRKERWKGRDGIEMKDLKVNREINK